MQTVINTNVIDWVISGTQLRTIEILGAWISFFP